MSKEYQARVNRYATLIENGNWQQSIREMVADDLTRGAIHELCDSINFYWDNDFEKYLTNTIAAQENKKALDGFFAKNI